MRKERQRKTEESDWAEGRLGEVAVAQVTKQ